MSSSEKSLIEPVLDIDHLRSFEVDPAYFGLGFIQLKIKTNSRVHFYHKDLPVLVEEPHNHRYNFISYIMQGRFEQELYRFDEAVAANYEMVWEDCKPGKEGKGPLPVLGHLKEIFHAEFRAGDYYNVDADLLHTVKGHDNAITYLVRQGKNFKDFAGVVREIGAEKVCPFSQPIPVAECWEMIEDMLIHNPGDRAPIHPEKPKKKKKKFGYHVMDIPKGEVGEPSKIIEEAYEILDSHEQGVNIMTHVEMSDLYGALDRYREKYHPSLTMDDINAMYRVTRRAFDNGKRK